MNTLDLAHLTLVIDTDTTGFPGTEEQFAGILTAGLHAFRNGLITDRYALHTARILTLAGPSKADIQVATWSDGLQWYPPAIGLSSSNVLNDLLDRAIAAGEEEAVRFRERGSGQISMALGRPTGGLLAVVSSNPQKANASQLQRVQAHFSEQFWFHFGEEPFTVDTELGETYSLSGASPEAIQGQFYLLGSAISQVLRRPERIVRPPPTVVPTPPEDTIADEQPSVPLKRASTPRDRVRRREGWKPYS